MTDFGGVDNTVEDPFEDTTVFDAAELVDEKDLSKFTSPVYGTRTASVPHQQHLTRRDIRQASMSRQREPASLA